MFRPSPWHAVPGRAPVPGAIRLPIGTRRVTARQQTPRRRHSSWHFLSDGPAHLTPPAGTQPAAGGSVFPLVSEEGGADAKHLGPLSQDAAGSDSQQASSPYFWPLVCFRKEDSHFREFKLDMEKH